MTVKVRSSSIDEEKLISLISELKDFLSELSVCEVELSDHATCSKRSVQCLTSLYTCLATLIRDIWPHPEVFKSVLSTIRLSAVSVPCLHPVFAWETFLPPILTMSASRAEIFNLLEAIVRHQTQISHPTLMKNHLQKLCDALSDSDSAFYASDASDHHRTSSGDASQSKFPRTIGPRLHHLIPYAKFLTSDDVTLVFDTLTHLSRLLTVASKQLCLELFVAVILPTIEARLMKSASLVDAALVQNLLAMVQEQMLTHGDVFALCRDFRLFHLTLSSRNASSISGDVYRFMFSFVQQELKMIMKNGGSLESLTVW